MRPIPSAGASADAALRPPATGRAGALALALAAALVLGLGHPAVRAQGTPAATAIADAGRLEAAGRFSEATEVLRTAAVAADLPDADRSLLGFEAERLRRIRLDHPLTRSDLRQALRRRLREVTDAEIDGWIREGRLERRVIDGQERFLRSSVSNLIFRHPELEPRRIDPPDPSRVERAQLENARSITAAARRLGTPYVEPRRIEVTHRITVRPDAVSPGETLRAWVPVPRRYPFQDGFTLIGSSSPVQALGGPEETLRSAFLETVAATNTPTVLTLHYAYTAHGVRFDPDAADAGPAGPTTPDLAPFLLEEPHVEFTDRIRSLSATLVRPGIPPARQARIFYDWIAENIRYSYAPEYSTFRNLSEACLRNGYGDCGQEALLLIALCRLNGIPARWQSGWSLFPGDETIHDWCEIHLSPLGWIPVDPYMGIYATRYARSLSEEERRELADFHFGGLPQYRLIANSDHCRPLSPPKRHPRSDTVDFQRGEVEASDRNLYFDAFDYALEWREVPLPDTR